MQTASEVSSAQRKLRLYQGAQGMSSAGVGAQGWPQPQPAQLPLPPQLPGRSLGAPTPPSWPKNVWLCAPGAPTHAPTGTVSPRASQILHHPGNTPSGPKFAKAGQTGANPTQERGGCFGKARGAGSQAQPTSNFRPGLSSVRGPPDPTLARLRTAPDSHKGQYPVSCGGCLGVLRLAHWGGYPVVSPSPLITKVETKRAVCNPGCERSTGARGKGAASPTTLADSPWLLLHSSALEPTRDSRSRPPARPPAPFPEPARGAPSPRSPPGVVLKSVPPGVVL